MEHLGFETYWPTQLYEWISQRNNFYANTLMMAFDVAYQEMMKKWDPIKKIWKG